MLLLPFISYSGPVCRKKQFSSQEIHQPLIAIQLLPVFLVATLRSLQASLLPVQISRLCSTHIREQPQLLGWLEVLASCTSTMECQASYFPDGYLLLVLTLGYSALWPDCHGDTPVSDDTGQ